MSALKKTTQTTQTDVEALEETMAQYPQVDLEVDHYFSDGLYGRAMYIPAGVALTGKAHKRDHLNFLLKGKITVMTDAGMQTIEAPKIIPATKGIKRAGFAHTDVIWVTVHATNAKDPDEAEAELVEPLRPEIQELIEQNKIKLECKP